MLRKNINTVAMLTGDTLLRHFSQVMYHGRNRRLHTLISYVLVVSHSDLCKKVTVKGLSLTLYDYIPLTDSHGTATCPNTA